jgi:hypothetical protein
MGKILRGLRQLGKGIMISDYQGLSKRGLQQVGKGNMIMDHQGLGKRHNAQGPLIGWARGLKFIKDRQEIGHGKNAPGAPTVGQGDHDQ